MPTAKRRIGGPTREDKHFAAFLAWFESENGRYVLAWMKSRVQDRSSLEQVVGGDINVHKTIANEGARTFFLGILNEIREAKKHATGESNDIAQFDLDGAIDAAGTAIFEQ